MEIKTNTTTVIEVSDAELKQLIATYICDTTDYTVTPNMVSIWSSENYDLKDESGAVIRIHS